MIIETASNPVFADVGGERINLTIEHPTHGTIPFTAWAGDTTEHGVDLYTRALAEEFGPVAPYMAPVRFATVADALAGLKRDVDLLAKKKRDAVVADISAAEMASWPIKRAEALAYRAAGQAATDADAPNLAAEAQARATTPAALVDKVLAKSATLSALEAAIAGACGKHQDALTALAADQNATVASLEAYDISTGWPL